MARSWIARRQRPSAEGRSRHLRVDELQQAGAERPSLSGCSLLSARRVSSETSLICGLADHAECTGDGTAIRATVPIESTVNE